MNIEELSAKARAIWPNKLTLAEIITLLGVDYGDVCRYARGAKKDAANHTDDELKKELGNIIFSTIRWCDDLGFDPEECIQKAVTAQEKFQKENS